MKRKKICFLSDAHFGVPVPGYDDREERFRWFCEQEAHAWSDLYIVGDLFDFWVEYRWAIRPDYFNVLHQLRQLVGQGIKVHYLAGNHDFALGPFLRKTIGLAVYPGAIDRKLQGRRFHIYHGDGLLKKDFGYRILKKLLRNRVNQWLYKLMHPNIGVPLGSFISGSSRKYLDRPEGNHFLKEYRECARSQLKKGYDVVMYGHVHYPDFVRYGELGTYCNVGAWLKYCSYAILEGGELTLLKFQEDGASFPVSPVDEK
jgi:UDP-2,3-diacylglucosamine hydrolase